MARISTPAEAGIYSFVATSRTKSAITIAVGEKEVTGEVLRGPAPVSTPTVSAKPSPTAATSASPTPEVTTASAYTMAKVKENNSATSCWSVINGKVYDLTKWINSHPGGASAIKGLCGIDGTSSFTAQHRGQGSPASNLANYLLGPLAS
jgi:cytochrome b involved in lipid metabolism